MTDHLVFVGVSTTGPIPGVHHVWEIGLVEQRTDGSRHRHHLYVQPNLANAAADTLASSRFYERTCAFGAPSDKLRFSDSPAPDPGWTETYRAASKVARATAGAVLVGIDVAPTVAFLDRFLRATGVGPAWSRRVVDVDTLADGFEIGRGYPALNDAAHAVTALEVADEAARIHDAVHGARATAPATTPLRHGTLTVGGAQ